MNKVTDYIDKDMFLKETCPNCGEDSDIQHEWSKMICNKCNTKWDSKDEQRSVSDRQAVLRLID